MKKQKNKAILFDFMRTLYDPEKGALAYGTKRILSALSETHDLYLISYQENQREALIEELGIRDYFKEIAFVKAKTERTFKKTIGTKRYRTIWVVGDRIEDEIILGNALGWRTIWVAQGKFKARTPRTRREYPLHTAKNLYAILKIIHR